MIHAGAYDDLHHLNVRFDATPYFERTNDETLQELVLEEFRTSEASDDVALALEDEIPELARLFAFIRIADVGFECWVDETEALAWISEHRPSLDARLREVA